MTRTHATFFLEAANIPEYHCPLPDAHSLRCHGDGLGPISVFLCGTRAELLAFGERVVALALAFEEPVAGEAA